MFRIGFVFGEFVFKEIGVIFEDRGIILFDQPEVGAVFFALLQEFVQ